MAPVGPLHFVARQVSAWIITFYILATSFVTSVEWRDLGYRTQSASVTQLLLLKFVHHIVKSYKRCRSKKNHNNTYRCSRIAVVSSVYAGA